MAPPVRPRWGSLQFYPRKKAAKKIPSVNWDMINSEGVQGFIFYKVGMASAVVKDNTPDSMTKGKKKITPVTILEAPNMKIFSVRFYKNNQVAKEIVVSNDKDIKRVLKVPKKLKNFDAEVPKDFENIRLLVYSLPSQTGVKKTPDLIEVGINAPNKLDYVKLFIGKEIFLSDFVNKTELFDVRGVTKGKGTQGPVKRFGLSLKQHKTEKGVRRPGSLGPWHPARVTFRTPMMGQMGLFSRINYNHRLISIGKISEKNINPTSGFNHYGNIKSTYLILEGSVQGPAKRAILLTPSFRPTKKQAKKKYEFQELLT